MIAMFLTELASALSPVTFAADDGSGGSTWLLILGPAGAGGVYFGLWTYYRNTDKSHAFEHETAVDAKPVAGSEHKVSKVTGTQATRISGDNVRDYRKRVQRIKDNPG